MRAYVTRPNSERKPNGKKNTPKLLLLSVFYNKYYNNPHTKFHNISYVTPIDIYLNLCARACTSTQISTNSAQDDNNDIIIIITIIITIIIIDSNEQSIRRPVVHETLLHKRPLLRQRHTQRDLREKTVEEGAAARRRRGGHANHILPGRGGRKWPGCCPHTGPSRQ